jgi:hypothetical protein
MIAVVKKNFLEQMTPVLAIFCLEERVTRKTRTDQRPGLSHGSLWMKVAAAKPLQLNCRQIYHII